MNRAATIMGIVFFGLLAGFLFTAVPARSQDRGYDQRAQEAVAGLIRFNGLQGWVPGRPETWPESSSASSTGGKTTRPTGGVSWDRSTRPAGLTGLILPNQGLQLAADLSGLGALTQLDLSGNHLRDINLEGNFSLTELSATKNKLGGLKLDGCPRLTRLALSVNQIKTLELSANPALRELAVSMNQLSAIDLGHNPELAVFEAMNNRLTDISVTANPALTRLMLSYNQISELDLAFNPQLSELGIRDNGLRRLDLSHNPGLTELTASRNQLTELNLAHSPHLAVLALDHNQLTRLDLSLAEALTHLSAQGNPLSEIIIGQNQLENLVSLNLDDCRLPLSQLAPLSGRAQNRARFGEQEPVLFTERKLALGETLDLSDEARLNGVETDFTVQTERKRRVPPEDYETADGLIIIKKPGRYLVRMTNEAVFSSEKNQSTKRTRTFKTKVYTGVIEVVAPPETDSPS
jgi:Leucine-rich repeat (LRR) protein